ncbi:hypothetical protein HDU67_008852 [Dinochytrium kinnereticum]|nr:hypothetical protein HDU67_008852 [Dinochytrium kinnereticum]
MAQISCNKLLSEKLLAKDRYRLHQQGRYGRVDGLNCDPTVLGRRFLENAPMFRPELMDASHAITQERKAAHFLKDTRINFKVLVNLGNANPSSHPTVVLAPETEEASVSMESSELLPQTGKLQEDCEVVKYICAELTEDGGRVSVEAPEITVTDQMITAGSFTESTLVASGPYEAQRDMDASRIDSNRFANPKSSFAPPSALAGNASSWGQEANSPEAKEDAMGVLGKSGGQEDKDCKSTKKPFGFIKKFKKSTFQNETAEDDPKASLMEKIKSCFSRWPKNKPRGKEESAPSKTVKGLLARRKASNRRNAQLKVPVSSAGDIETAAEHAKSTTSNSDTMNVVTTSTVISEKDIEHAGINSESKEDGETSDFMYPRNEIQSSIMGFSNDVAVDLDCMQEITVIDQLATTHLLRDDYNSIREVDILTTASEMDVSTPAGSKTLDDFVYLKKLGAGAFGSVSYLAHEKKALTEMFQVLRVRHKDTKKYFAMKVITKKDDDCVLDARNEIKVLKACRGSPYIIQIDCSFQDASTIYVVSELCSSDLSSYVRRKPFHRLGKRDMRVVARDVLLGIEFLHAHNIIHCDIKPQNILVNVVKGRLVTAKLGDFNVSEQGDPSQISTGTVGFIAPEAIIARNQGPALDWFSFGVSIFQVHFGRLPFSGNDPLQQYCSMVQWPITLNTDTFNPNRDINDMITKPMAHFSSLKFLSFNPYYRLGYFGARSVKQHPFFSYVDWDNIPAPLEPKWKEEPSDESLNPSRRINAAPQSLWDVEDIDSSFS